MSERSSTPLWASILTLALIAVAFMALGWGVRGFYAGDRRDDPGFEVVEASDKSYEDVTPSALVTEAEKPAIAKEPEKQPEKEPESLSAKAKRLSDAGDYAGALAAYDAILKLDSGDLEASYLKGKMLLALGKGAEGEKQLWSTLDRQPGYVEAAVTLCEHYVGTGKFRSAISTGRKTLDGVPANGDLEYWVGAGYEGLGNVSVAISWYKAATVDQPGHVSATRALSRLGASQ